MEQPGIDANCVKRAGYTPSPVGLGCASAWGQAWYDEQRAVALVERALELGVTVFDTGPTYSGGNAEPRLGKALKGKDTSALLVSTKIGSHFGPRGRLYKDWSKNAIFRSLDVSRSRLGLDCIPLIYLHGPKIGDLNEALFDTLEEAKSKGMVRLLGVNSFDDDVLALLHRMSMFDVVMLDYNLLRIRREPLIERLYHAGKFVVAGSALANHLHAPQFLRPKTRADVWYLLRALKNYRGDYWRARRVSFLTDLADWTPAQVALAFVAANRYVSVSMFSTTRIEHLEENLRYRSMAFPNALNDRIRQVLQ